MLLHGRVSIMHIKIIANTAIMLICIAVLAVTLCKIGSIIIYYMFCKYQIHILDYTKLHHMITVSLIRPGVEANR